MLRLYYQYPVFVNLLGFNLSNLTGGYDLFAATAVFKNEPYAHRLEGEHAMKLAMRLFAATARCTARLRRDRRGVSAVEFALLLPVMMTLFLGSVEASQGIAADRKVELTAHALADLASQYTDITNADMTQHPQCRLGDHRALPDRRSQGSGVGDRDQFPGQCHGGVERHAQRHRAHRRRRPSACRPSLATPNSYLMLAQVQYGYNPAYGYVLTGTFDLERSKFHAAAGIGLDRTHRHR